MERSDILVTQSQWEDTGNHLLPNSLEMEQEEAVNRSILCTVGPEYVLDGEYVPLGVLPKDTYWRGALAGIQACVSTVIEQ